MSKYIPTREKINEPKNRLKRHEDYGAVYIDGTVATPLGLVEVLSQDGLTRLEFAHDGYLYRHEFGEYHEEAFLVTLAKRFALEVSGGEAET